MTKEEIVKRFYWTRSAGENTCRVRWTRNDGAVVKWDESSPWPNPVKDSARMWTAWDRGIEAARFQITVSYPFENKVNRVARNPKIPLDNRATFWYSCNSTRKFI